VVGRSRKTGEELTRFYPNLPAVLSSRTKRTQPLEGLLDSGSDGIVIPLSTAKYLELELVKEEFPMEVVGRRVDRYKSKLSITIGRGGNYCSQIDDIEVNVPVEGDTPILFGRNPVFELFLITFNEKEKKFTMKPNV